MDQRLDESFGLDEGAIGVEFDTEQEIVSTSDCDFGESNSEHIVTIQMDDNMQMDRLKDQIMDTDDCEITDEMDYVQESCITNDMPILGGEEEVLSDQHQVLQTIQFETQDATNEEENEDESNEVILPDVLTSKQSINISHTVQQPFSPTVQTFRVANTPALRPVSIAPKPVVLFTNKSYNNVVKKVSMTSLQQRTGGLLGTEVSGRQVMMLPGGSGRLKLVGTGASAVSGASDTPNQLVRNSSGQLLQLRQAAIPPLTKLSISQGGDTVTSGVQKTSSPRYISLQQAQQMGLLSGGKIHQVLAVSPTKQGPTNSTTIVRPMRQMFSTIRSPTKILPAPPHGSGIGKVILSPGSQSVVIRPPTSKPSQQLIKMETALSSGLLTGVPAGQKYNSQQIHPINFPGKGVQYVRLVAAPGVQGQAPRLQPPSPVRIAPVTTLSTPNAPAKLQAKTPQLLPKTFLIADFQNNTMQLGPNKGQSLISTPNATMKKIIQGKPQTKLVPVSFNLAPALHKITQASTPITFSVEPNSGDNKNIDEPTEEDKESLQDNLKIVHTKSEHIEEMVAEEVTEEEVMESAQLSPSDDPPSPKPAPMETKHIVVVPASYLKDLQQNDLTGTKSLSIAANVEIKQEVSETPTSNNENAVEFSVRPRKPCNCTKSQCLKLYCDCFANGEFCNQCNCNNCFNNLENEEYRQKAIRSCLDRNPNAFRPKIGKAKNNLGPDEIRRHNKGCNCKRSGCLKNYCECYEGMIACSANCKCVGCRNIEDSRDKKSLRRARTENVMGISSSSLHEQLNSNSGNRNTPTLNIPSYRTPLLTQPSQHKQPCSIMTNDVIEAVCECLLAQAADAETMGETGSTSAAKHVLEEFAHCLQDIINAAQHTQQKSVTSTTQKASA